MSGQGVTATAMRSPREDVAEGIDKEAVKRAFLDKLFYMQGKFAKLATLTDYYMALAYTVRDLMMRRWVSTAAAYTTQKARTVCYLSAEYLIGPHLGNNLVNRTLRNLSYASQAVGRLNRNLNRSTTLNFILCCSE